MGTERDWMSVAFFAIFWGGGMLVWEALRKSDAHIKPALVFMDVLSWTLAGLCYGIGVTFRWQAFHWPLILLTVATFVGGVFAAISARQKVRSTD